LLGLAPDIDRDQSQNGLYIIRAPGQHEHAIDVRGPRRRTSRRPAGRARMLALTVTCKPEESMNASSRGSSTTSRADK
jgi:hypothetical protein